MTDMRATERLLERCDELVSRVGMGNVPDHKILAELTDTLAELRRRGDTLVRADDLRIIVDGTGSLDWELIEGPEKIAIIDARRRLENALGGKML